MLALLLQLALAGPDDDVALLAPVPADLHEQLDDAERVLIVADALGEAVARLQNDWVLRGYGDEAPTCDDAVATSIASRAVAFGTSWRDAAELAGARADRIALLPDAPTLAPLLTPRDRERMAAVAERAAHQRRVYLEAAAWHARQVAAFAKKCASPLVVTDGVPRLEHRAKDEDPVATAIATAVPGRVCTPDAQVDASGVVVVIGDRACFSAAACDCVPKVVSPGAVLGP